MRPANLVASPTAIGSTPEAKGSSVPPWPTLVLCSPASRRARLTADTHWVEPMPTGLSRMIQPWSAMGQGDSHRRHAWELMTDAAGNPRISVLAHDGPALGGVADEPDDGRRRGHAGRRLCLRQL